jgi:glycosyltransferase involved in cell wall biosynthesis
MKNSNAKTSRVLITCRDLQSQGGVANVISILMSHLSKAFNYEHFVIGSRIEDKRIILKLLRPILDNLRLVWKYCRTGFSCVHLNPSLNAKALLRDGLFTTTLATIGVKGIIVFIHGWDKREEKRIRNNRVLKCIFTWVFGKANLILVLASSFREAMIDMGFDPRKVHTITTMFDGSIFKQDAVPERQKGKTILFLSRFVAEKGVYELLEAFVEIAASFSDAKLVLAGDGPEREKIIKFIEAHQLSDRIGLPGYIRGKDKVRILWKSDVFVFPTYYGEGCPVSLLEAMAAGLPVITTSVGGIPDIIANGQNGILLDQVTPKAIATAIKHLFQDESLSSQMGSNNRTQAWSNYEASIVTRKIESFYIQLMSSS